MALAAGIRVGPYEVISSLGSGGMGDVYKARDTRLNRVIALKTLSGEKTDNSDLRRRFLLEAQAASQLNHPNIVTIHENLEEDGVCFLVMEYVSGRTLESLIASRSLTIADALKYAGEIADALGAAHAAGIIHRDLKPANIMVTEDGRVKLLDFGLARFLDRDMPDGGAAITQTMQGVIVGTAAYMSPEQAEGLPLDVRSDIFSFGAVLYEMLSGKRAFRGNSWISTLAAIMGNEPQRLQEVQPAIPLLLEQHVARCLRKNPAERFQTMLEVKRILADGSLSIASSAETEIASIAVLPFANLSSDKENEYFSDGLAEEIIDALNKIPELKVIARASAFAFRDKEHDLRAIGQRLRVGTILEGSVRRAGNRIRITAQLIKVEDESHLWSERYDRELTDVFAIQDDISQAIANALKVKLVPRGYRSTNIEAFQSYLKGIYWYQRYTAQSLAMAKESFEDALAHDANYAPAHAGLAVFYYGIGALSIKRMTDVAPLARASATKALAIDQGLSEAHSVLGLIDGAVQYEWKTAEMHFQRAMAIDPVPPLVRVRYALYFLLPLGRFAEAIVQYQRALETDPLSMMVHFGLSFAYYCDRQYDEAVKHAARAVDLYPDYWLVHFAMGMALSQKGTIQDASVSLEKGLQLSPSFSLATGYLAALNVRAGELARAEALIAELLERKSRQYVSSAAFAVYYAVLGRADVMFDYLEAALVEREPFLTRMDAEPYFWPYRSDPRYEALRRSMRLQ